MPCYGNQRRHLFFGRIPDTMMCRDFSLYMRMTWRYLARRSFVLVGWTSFMPTWRTNSVSMVARSVTESMAASMSSVLVSVMQKRFLVLSLLLQNSASCPLIILSPTRRISLPGLSSGFLKSRGWEYCLLPSIGMLVRKEGRRRCREGGHGQGGGEGRGT